MHRRLATLIRRLRALPRERVRLHAATSAIVLVTAACSAVLISLRLAQEAPRWWQLADWATPEADRSAEALENRLLSNVYHARPNATALSPRPMTTRKRPSARSIGGCSMSR